MLPLRAASGVVLVAIVSSSVALAASSCRCNKPDSGEGSAEAAASVAVPSTLDDRYEGTDGPVADASNRFLDASPKVGIDLDGPVDPICTGSEIPFAIVVVDTRCAIGSARAKALRAALERDDGGAVTLRQEAKVDAGGRVALRMINTGASPLTLPLSYSAKLPAFTALAEDEGHAIYELAPPRFEVSHAGPPSANDRAHFARIVLPPGGAAVAVVTLDRGITKVLERGRDAGASARCPDGGDCGPTRLGKGRYTIHVGELLTDVEAGPPARVIWDAP